MKTSDQMLLVLKEYVREAGTQRAAAESLNITPQHISDLMRGRRDISENIAKQLGYTRMIIFQQIKETK